MATRFFPSIDTSRLLLRPLRPEDAEALLSVFSDHEVMKYWNSAPWTSLEDAQRFIEASARGMDGQASITLGIVLKASGTLIGKCMLFNYSVESKRAEIGFGIARTCWRQGFVSEAGGALLRYGFHTLGLRRIEAEIDPQNVTSAKALERLGFIKEGFLRQRWEINGVVSDSAFYGLLASDHAS